MSIESISNISQASMADLQPYTDYFHKIRDFDEKTTGFFTQEESNSSFQLLPNEPEKVTEWGKTKLKSDLPFPALAEQQGLHCESHNVTTSDGYIVTMFRVRDPEGPYFNKGAKAVFVQHGLLADSNDWILLGEKSLAVKLAKAGYDAWFGNNRGTRYSRGHIKYNAEDSKDAIYYFDYSFYELGKYDLPAMIDYVRQETGQDKLSYMAHSQGTSQMFSALAENHGSMNDKIDLFIAMAPIVDLHNTQSGLLRSFSEQWRALIWFSYNLNVHEINLGEGEAPVLCAMFPDTCFELSRWTGNVSPYADPAATKLQSSEIASGCSMKQLLHYGQDIITGVFKQYDYGSDLANIKKYGTEVPPLIDLDKISQDIPIYMYAGNKDDLADETDVEWLKNKMGDRVKFTTFIPDFTHGGFSTGKYTGWTKSALSHIAPPSNKE